MKVVVEVTDVGKVIGGRQIFEHISFSCTRDTILFVRGGNGTGKSTLLKMLAGIYEPTAGEVRRQTKYIGYVPEHFPEDIRFKVKEYLLLTASFHGTVKDCEARIMEYMDLFGLSPFENKPIAACSKGTKQKVGIIQALLMEPDLLLLDEPLTGLDQESQEAIIRLLQSFCGTVAIIFTAHEDGPITELATHVLQIETGEVSTVGQSVRRKRQKEIHIMIPAGEKMMFIPAGQIEMNGRTAVITVEQDSSDDMLRKLLGMGCSILEVRNK
ncbi:ATP-binding cassette domain-containing protein [Sporosarcina sp. Sa2YVA2]|uniref:ATP-binding cassette domain-containing protein n=1 Tax=Sporosarcina quadrami TaxID=2762234 RepID=A0ABR8UB66_9BACL|nr:ATP-binding cassette domain-containing protein [Sporosarcina quadrami]